MTPSNPHRQPQSSGTIGNALVLSLHVEKAASGKDSSAAAVTLVKSLRVNELEHGKMPIGNYGYKYVITLIEDISRGTQVHSMEKERSTHDHQNAYSVTTSLSRTNCTRYIVRQNHSLTGCRVQRQDPSGAIR